MSENNLRNEHQIKALWSTARFIFLLCARRSGKTHLMKYKICKKLRLSPKGSNVLYMAPSNPQAKALMWNDLEELFIQFNWEYTANISGQYFKLTGGRRVYILGAEKFNRIRGMNFYHIFLDEFAFYTKKFSDLWRALRPTLSDTFDGNGGGGATLATTPDGKATEAYEVYMKALTDPEWQVFSWHTADNPYIPKEEIEAAKRELDEMSFRQEYEAAWMSKEGLAYYNFDETKHVKTQPPIQPNVPLILCFDFNTNPTTLLLAQSYQGFLSVKKEYSFKNSSTEATIKAFVDDFIGIKSSLNLIIRGDAAGNNRSSNTGRSDYHYVKEALDHYGFNYKMEVPRANPAIVDRVKYFNSWLQPFVGKHKIEIDPGCTDLIRDLAAQELDGRKPTDKNNLGHKADAMGYCIYREYIAQNRKGSRTLLG
jgi:PBSX family phage terminase large subunit